jgi:hypothetical protein
MNRISLPSALVVFFLFAFPALYLRCFAFLNDAEIIVFQIQKVVLFGISIWCMMLFVLTFKTQDLFLVFFVITVFVSCLIVTEGESILALLACLAAISAGKCVFSIIQASRHKTATTVFFLCCVTCLYGISSMFPSDVNHGQAYGSRWSGLWDNPNTYGMLMGAGSVLAVGLRAGMKKRECRMQNSEAERKNADIGNFSTRILQFFMTKVGWFLGIVVAMMGVGLAMSYSRGAWLAAAIGLMYLAWCYGKLKWRYVLPAVLVTAATIALFWHSTADTDPWYLKRLDFSRPSAQHRVSAWRGAMQMMRDHPLGVGWNNAVSLYDKNYSPPEGGAAALTMNSYLMLGTELGLPGLLCFVTYVGLCLRGKCKTDTEAGRIQAACRAGALVFVVAFWFDGGLFDLPTAALFWVLLELGSVRNSKPVETPICVNS